MRIGVYRPKELPESFNVCIDNIIRHFPQSEVNVVESSIPDELAPSDLIWDPRAGGGHAPAACLLSLKKPLVVTLHGIGPIMFPEHYSNGFLRRLKVIRNNFEKKKKWKACKNDVAKVVTVSNFSKRVIHEKLGVQLDAIDVIYNGVNTEIFECRSIDKPIEEPYFLHISNDESRKNVDRIIAAYRSLPQNTRWPLVLKLSSNREVDIPGVKLIKERLSERDIASLYKSAGALVFPSIYEGFGIPIIEAMATGCPVITSKNTACQEVAGDFATLVSATSVSSISKAMEKMMQAQVNEEAIKDMHNHAKTFDWKTAADEYLELFRSLLNQN